MTVTDPIMKTRKAIIVFILKAWLLLLASSILYAESIDQNKVTNVETKMGVKIEAKLEAKGSFEVKLDPQKDDAAPAGRIIISKTYEGGLVGHGVGQMLSKRTESGESVYSAIEEVSAKLQGKTGGFTLAHVGVMSSEGMELNIRIVKGSGTGELQGITGELEIKQEDGQHFYVLTYTLPDHNK